MSIGLECPGDMEHRNECCGGDIMWKQHTVLTDRKIKAKL